MDDKMQAAERRRQKSYMQLRMGLLGAATAMLVCFGAAIAFAGAPLQGNDAQSVAAAD